MILFTLGVSVVNLIISSAIYLRKCSFEQAFKSQKAAEYSTAALVLFNVIFFVFINFSGNSHFYAMIISACFLLSTCYAGRIFVSQNKSESAFCIASFSASIFFFVDFILKMIPFIKSAPL